MLSNNISKLLSPPSSAYFPSHEQDYYPEYYPQHPQEQGGYLQEQSPDYLSMLNNIVKVLTVLLLIYFGSKLKLEHIILNPLGLFKKILKIIFGMFIVHCFQLYFTYDSFAESDRI